MSEVEHAVRHVKRETSGTGTIGIVTVLFNSQEVLPDFLASLRAQTYTRYVVYAVDNGSADGSAAMCRNQGEAFVVTENKANLGFAAGTNQGIRQAMNDGCEYVLILNNDVAFQPDFLDTLLHGLRSHHADMAAPLTYYFNPPDKIWAAGGTLQRAFGYRPVHLGMDQQDRGQFNADRRIGFAPGSCILAKRDVFSAIGLLDEAYFTYWEDTDFAVRASKHGLRMYLISKAKLWHKVSSLAGQGSPFQRYYAVRNHAMYVRKHCSPVAAGMLNALYLLAYRMAGLRAGAVDERVATWKEGWKLGQSAR